MKILIDHQKISSSNFFTSSTYLGKFQCSTLKLMYKVHICEMIFRCPFTLVLIPPQNSSS